MTIKTNGIEHKQTVEESNKMALGKRNYLLITFCLLPLFMIVGASASGYGYDPNPNTSISKKTFLPEVFSVQGVVYCKSAFGVVPLKGDEI